jgi:hypothetical protein
MFRPICENAEAWRRGFHNRCVCDGRMCDFFFVLFDEIGVHGENILQNIWDRFCPHLHVQLRLLCRQRLLDDYSRDAATP